MKEMNDSERLQEQIYQIREVIATVENQSNGVPSIQPEELWTTLMNNSKINSIHPRLQQMVHGHVDIEQIKQGLKRLENDYQDLNLSEQEMYDPFKHELNGGVDNTWATTEDVDEAPVNDEPVANEQTRDKEQRPLSAYGVKTDTE